MMKSFHCVPVTDLENESVSALAYSTATFLVGTDTGTLLNFSLSESTDDLAEVADGGKFCGKIRLNNSRKKIDKVAILEDLQLAICLEDGNLHLLPVGLNAPGYVLCRNASTFCLHESRGSLSNRRTDGEKARPGGALSSTDFDICVGLKRKIVLYSKPGTDFTPIKEIALNETPLAVCWVEHWICVGTRKEYLSIQDEQLKTSEILTLDGQMMTRGGPRMQPLPDGEVMLIGLENLGIFFSLLTQMPTQRNTIKWPSDLTQISVCLPYLVGLTASGRVEVYSIHGQSVCQTLQLPSPLTAIATNGRRLLVSAKNTIHCLFPVPFKQQLHKLLLEGRTGDALDLLSANFGADDPRRVEELSAFHNLAGWAEFNQLQFPTAFRHFSYAGTDILRIIAFWSAYLPSWWRTPRMYLEQQRPREATGNTRPSTDLESTLIPPVQELATFIRDRLERSSAVEGGSHQGEAKHQVLLELANSSMAAFLSKERASLLLGRSERVDLQALREVAAAAKAASSLRDKEGSLGKISTDTSSPSLEDLLSLLLVLVDTLLFILMVEGDDVRWRSLVSDSQQPLTCTVEDCRSFLLAVNRPDALAAMLARFDRREEALEIWASIVRGDLRVAPKATTLADGIQEILRLLTLSSFESEDEAPSYEEEDGDGTSDKKKDASDERQAQKHYAHQEKLYKQYAPLVLRADPFLAKRLFFEPCPSPSDGEENSSSNRIHGTGISSSSSSSDFYSPNSSSLFSPSSSFVLCRYTSPAVVMELLGESVEDTGLKQRLQESFLEVVVLGKRQSIRLDERFKDNPELKKRWTKEIGSLQTHLAATYIDKLLSSGEGGERRGREEEDRGQLQEIRSKLLQLLEYEEGYDVAALLKKVEGSWLLRETALLYGKLGRHLEALEIIAVRLEDEETAEAYCIMMDVALQPVVDAMSSEEYLAHLNTDEIFRLLPPPGWNQHASLQKALIRSSSMSFSIHLDTLGRYPGINSQEDSRDVSTAVLPSIFSPDSPWKTERHELLRELYPSLGGMQAPPRETTKKPLGCGFIQAKREGEFQTSSPSIQATPPISRRSPGMLRALLKVLLRAWKLTSSSTEKTSSSNEVSSSFSSVSHRWRASILSLMSKYGAHTDLEPGLVLRLLPDDWHLSEVSDYLIASLREELHGKMKAGLQEQLSTIAYLHTYSDWAHQRSACYVITPERSCPVCTRRLGSVGGGFVAYPDGTCVHLHCANPPESHLSAGPNMLSGGGDVRLRGTGGGLLLDDYSPNE
ncbi:tgf beta receptor associated-like [Cystoisospora suis]|uniref:Tgf beta receptor associated-like n=1 Tax=Cystoisospora suis TaxID=483139 RepID=A0A2C6LAD1_9APIC|nr:tgf beta receptor associated-like [Cystoisospora suis]